MSQFLYAWELGAGLGHVGTFLPVGRRLRNDGHQVVLALRETQSAPTLISGDEFPWVQAPFLAERSEPEPPISYAAILARFGFDREDVLLGHVRAWMSLFKTFGTRVVIADHSPAALVAARAAGLPAVFWGTGFFLPPAGVPLPALRPWAPMPSQALAEVEAPVLAAINAVLGRLGAPPMAALHELFAVAETALLGFPEFDHYPERGAHAYWGHIGSAGNGILPDWPKLAGKRIFAYLRPNTAHLQPTLQALADCGQPVLLYCPGLPSEVAAQLAKIPNFRLSARPLDIGRVADEADLLVTYAAYATTVAFIQHGKPVLLLPTHLEQYLFARRVEASGLGLAINPERPPTDLPARLRQLLDDPAWTRRTREFRDRYAAFTQDHVVGNVCRRLTEIAAAAR